MNHSKITGIQSVKGSIEKLAEKSGVDMAFIARDQMRLWVSDCIKFSTPKTKAAGRKSVSIGIRAVFQPSKNAGSFQGWNDSVIERHTDEITTTTKAGKMRISKAKLSLRSVEAMGRVHDARRTSHGGARMQRRQRGQAWGGRFVVQQKDFNKFKREKLKSVGKMKAGWGKAAAHYENKTHAKARGYVDWVRALPAGGNFLDKLKDGAEKGTLMAYNDVPYAYEHIKKQGFMDGLQKKRQKDLARGSKKRMAELVNRFNNGGL